MKIIGTVERSKTNFYSIYPNRGILNCYPFGYGYSAEEAKEDFMIAIQEFREDKEKKLGYVPEEFNDIEVVFRYDISTLFEQFDFLNVSKFAKFAGINASKMRQYVSGAVTPGVKNSKKISDALKKVGEIFYSATL